jgi:hypothetical protein
LWKRDLYPLLALRSKTGSYALAYGRVDCDLFERFPSDKSLTPQQAKSRLAGDPVAGLRSVGPPGPGLCRLRIARLNHPSTGKPGVHCHPRLRKSGAIREPWHCHPRLRKSGAIREPWRWGAPMKARQPVPCRPQRGSHDTVAEPIPLTPSIQNQD